MSTHSVPPAAVPRIALVTARPRVEEKLLLEALGARGAEVTRIDDGGVHPALAGAGGLPAADPEGLPWDLVWNRSLAYGRALYLTRALEARGVPCLNAARVVETCGDKALTSLALERAGLPSPATHLAFTPEAALDAAEALGYPCVMKPLVGSWGRQVVRLDSRSAAEAAIELRSAMGSWQARLHYLQAYVEKPGRDARAFVVGERCVGAIWRHSEHWITNTARGGRVERAEHDGPLGRLAEAAARTVGGGLLAVDLVEGPEGLLVLEVNHSGEFRNSIEPTGVDLPGLMAEHAIELALRGRTAREAAPEAPVEAGPRTAPEVPA